MLVLKRVAEVAVFVEKSDLEKKCPLRRPLCAFVASVGSFFFFFLLISTVYEGQISKIGHNSTGE